MANSFLENEFYFYQSPHCLVFLLRRSCFRIQYMDSVTVPPHKDSDHLSNHPLGEKNFLIPITEMKNTNSIYIESEPDKKGKANFIKPKIRLLDKSTASRGTSLIPLDPNFYTLSSDLSYNYDRFYIGPWPIMKQHRNLLKGRGCQEGSWNL